MKRRSVILLGVIFLIFIGLGLPDALLGSSWNLVRVSFDVPLGYIGFTTVIAFVFTILSTYFAPFFLSKFQTRQIVFVSLLLTGSALIGMSLSYNYFLFILFAVPLGIGAGAIDFSINHYVTIHYKASHMNFLHSFYGVGVLIGPMVMALILRQEVWRLGYEIIGGILVFIVLVTFASRSLWFKESGEHREEHHSGVSIKEALKTKGVILSILIFLFYVHIESLFGILIASYYFVVRNVSYSEAAIATLVYYIGLTAGRFISGLVSEKISPNRLIMIGVGLMFLASFGMLFEYSNNQVYIALILIVGLGSGPVFPNMIHMNDKNFDSKKMSKIMSLQMTIAYISFGVLTPFMGFVFQWTSIELFPIVAVVMTTLQVIIVVKFMTLNLPKYKKT